MEKPHSKGVCCGIITEINGLMWCLTQADFKNLGILNMLLLLEIINGSQRMKA